MDTSRWDAVIVGARCAGATLAARLAGAGWRVLLVDRDRFPSDTVSTHMLFPDTLQRFDELGVLARLRAAHDIRMFRFGWRVLGHQVGGGEFTPVGGYTRGCCIRRVTLDAALVDTAVAAGALPRFGRAVVDLLGTGTQADPVRGVVLDDGEDVTARWVFGADGRASTMARQLRLRRTGELRGEMAMLFGYWRGLLSTEWSQMDVHAGSVLLSAPCEDGLHLLVLTQGPSLTRGSSAQRETRYRQGLRHFPAVLNPRLLDHAELVSPVVAAPETMLRGHYRRACGPGWALLGDAGHYKHPSTAQGIGDAVAQAWFVADALLDRDDLTGYQQWRDDHAAEHYEFSFRTARFPPASAAATYAGLAANPVAGQQFLDLFTKRRRPSEVFTARRRTRWKAAWTYEDGRQRATSLVEALDEPRLEAPVPACPDWSIRDLIAHLVGVAEDTASGAYLPEAPDAWRDPAAAARREAWTASHVAQRAGTDLPSLLRQWAEHGSRLETMLRRDEGFAADSPEWMLTAPAADLAVHMCDLCEALEVPVDVDAPIARLGFAVYRNWLGARLAERTLPALRLSDGERHWDLGPGAPRVGLTASRLELFRAVTGRRSAAQIRACAWDGDPEVYLPVISPYPLPPDPGPATPKRTGCGRAQVRS